MQMFLWDFPRPKDSPWWAVVGIQSLATKDNKGIHKKAEQYNAVYCVPAFQKLEALYGRVLHESESVI